MARLKVCLKVAKFQIQKRAAFNKQLCAMNKLAVGGSLDVYTDQFATE